MSDLFKILSIDGGGIRGIIPAMMLAEIETKTGKPIADMFDLIVGTSTGGILALGLVTPDANGGAKFSAASGVAMYEERGREIFQTPLFRRHIGQLFEEKFPAVGVERVLKEQFGTTRLKDALKPVVVTSYDIENRRPRFFKSRDEDDHEFLMCEVARCTSAAPTFFEPFKILVPENADGGLIDGGVIANNPAMCAYAEAIKHHEATNILMVSLGTGELPKQYLFNHAKRWGLIRWVRPVVDILMTGTSYTVDYQMKQLLPYMEEHKVKEAGQVDEKDQKRVIPRYFRFQVELDRKTDAMDDCSPFNIAALKKLAQGMIDNAYADGAMDAMLEQLV